MPDLDFGNVLGMDMPFAASLHRVAKFAGFNFIFLVLFQVQLHDLSPPLPPLNHATFPPVAVIGFNVSALELRGAGQSTGHRTGRLLA
jgi:hypothetical protein